MFELGVLVMAAVGVFWLIGGLLKLTFGFVGALFGGLFALFAAGLVGLLVLPIVLFALLPLLMPVLFVAAVVWLVVHASRSHAEPPRPAQG